MPNSHTTLPKILCVSLMWNVSLYCFLLTSPFCVAKCRKEHNIGTHTSISKVERGPLSRKHCLVLTTRQYEDDKHSKNALERSWDQGKRLLKYPSVWEGTLPLITLTQLWVVRYQSASQPQNWCRVSVPPATFPGSRPWRCSTDLPWYLLFTAIFISLLSVMHEKG